MSQWLGWIFSAILTLLIWLAERRIAEMADEKKKDDAAHVEAMKCECNRNAAIGEGMQALLRDRIMQAHDFYTKQGYCPSDKKYTVQGLYAPYHALGGNDVATQAVKEVLELPTEAPKQCKKS